MNPNGMYYFEIYERDNDFSSEEFIGRRYEQNGDALYWDEHGNWFFSYTDQVVGIDQDWVTVNSESLHVGPGIEGLLENMNADWLVGMGHSELPPILREYATVSVETRDEEAAKSAQSLLDRLRRAKDDPESSAA
jgi:hypothetical protein